MCHLKLTALEYAGKTICFIIKYLQNAFVE